VYIPEKRPRVVRALLRATRGKILPALDLTKIFEAGGELSPASLAFSRKTDRNPHGNKPRKRNVRRGSYSNQLELRAKDFELPDPKEETRIGKIRAGGGILTRVS